MKKKRAANRVLDLAELKRPDFAATIASLEELTAQDSVSYLHPSKHWEYPWALEQAALPPRCEILDAGCGASIFPVYLAGCGHRVSACDIELPGRLDRLHGVLVNYTCGDLTALPFHDNRFNVVFCISVIEHLPREKMPAALGELGRVLRPGGRLLLTTDFCRQAGEEMWYDGPGERFRVDWNVFDEAQLWGLLSMADGLHLAGELDLVVDWARMIPVMRRFHGYQHTAVGLVLEKEGFC
jgi:SAM-dependent methyltransferase